MSAICHHYERPLQLNQQWKCSHLAQSRPQQCSSEIYCSPLCLMLLSFKLWAQLGASGWKVGDSCNCMCILVHCMLDRAHPRSPLAPPLFLPVLLLHITIILKLPAEERCCCCRQNTVLHFHQWGEKKALLIAVVFHTGTTSIPLSPALKHLQNRQGE